MKSIPFSIPFTCKESADNVAGLIEDPILLSGYTYSNHCREWFESRFPGYRAFMTTSCTRALELAALALNIQPGDEIIMPSYNYVGVAGAFVNYGARLVLTDIEPDTMNLDVSLLERAAGPRTRAVVLMHYSGVACDIETVSAFCKARDIILIEDNAQGLGANHKGRPLGSFGDFSCVSFDRMKNVSAGEGGVLLCRPPFSEATDIAYEKGTNRSAFLRGKAPAYEWVAKGSNFSMSEYTSAILLPLLNRLESITEQRLNIWNTMYEALRDTGTLTTTLPHAQRSSGHNGHLFYLKFKNRATRDAVMNSLAREGIPAYFHYTPLHHSALGNRYPFLHGGTEHAETESGRLLRLPIHNYLSEDDISRIALALSKTVNSGVGA